MKVSFPAVVDQETRVLVLGSLPGEVSLGRAQYYAHPQNQFWRLMARVTGLPLPDLDYEPRLAALLSVGFGLWDVVRSAERTGSLDAAIRNHVPNGLAAFVQGLPRLEAIAFNGLKASAIGRKALAPLTDHVLLDLPSSSPAHTLAFETKAEAWSVLAAFARPAADRLS